MSAMSELDTLLTELSESVRAVQETAAAIREILSRDEQDHASQQPQEERRIALEDIRAVLLEKRKAGFRDEIKALLLRHGAERLTDINPNEYPAMLQEAEALGV